MITSPLNYRYIWMVFSLLSEFSQTVLTYKINISIINISHIPQYIGNFWISRNFSHTCIQMLIIKPSSAKLTLQWIYPSQKQINWKRFLHDKNRTWMDGWTVFEHVFSLRKSAGALHCIISFNLIKRKVNRCSSEKYHVIHHTWNTSTPRAL